MFGGGLIGPKGGLRRKKGLGGRKGVKRPALESWGRRLKGGGIGGGGRGGEKGVRRGGEGLEGEDFPGKFRETPRPPDPTRTSFTQN